MTRLSFIIFLNMLFLLFCSSTTDSTVLRDVIDYNQNDTSTTILWQSNYKLKWNDFQGSVDTTSQYRAITSTNLKTKLILSTSDQVEYGIMCLFEKKKSWTKDKKSTKLLQHEQLHFTIAELAARNMRKKLSVYSLGELDSLNSMITRVFNEAVEERRFINRTYDLETNHGIIADKQKQWEMKIANELKKLDEFSSIQVIIRRTKE